MLFHGDLEVWRPNWLAITLLQFYHQVLYKQAYWTNWPSAQNLYINSAYCHHIWLLGLEPTWG